MRLSVCPSICSMPLAQQHCIYIGLWLLQNTNKKPHATSWIHCWVLSATRSGQNGNETVASSTSGIFARWQPSMPPPHQTACHQWRHIVSPHVKVKKRIAVCATSTAPLQELTCHMGSHSVICHPAEVTFPPLPWPIKAGTRFSNPRGRQGWVDLVSLVTYQGGVPARRRSPIPVLTRLNIEQLRSCYEWLFHCAKPHATSPVHVCVCVCVCVCVAVTGRQPPSELMPTSVYCTSKAALMSPSVSLVACDVDARHTPDSAAAVPTRSNYSMLTASLTATGSNCDE